MSEEATMSEEASEKSNIVVVIALIVVGIVAAIAYYLKSQKKDEKRGKDVDMDEALATNSVDLKDIAYIASKLSPDSSQLDVLLAVASTPESIAWSTKSLAMRQKSMAKRMEDDKHEEAQKKADAKKSTELQAFDLDDDGWADDEDEDEETKKKAKLAEEIMDEKKKMGEELAKAAGKIKIPFEGLDDGVIGQKWVETTLKKAGLVPLDLRFLKDMTFEHEGKQVAAMDHPGLRRNLCFLAGRLNSMTLNSHPELLEAASKQRIDPTYFKTAADFRQRCGMLLEATLRTGVGLRNSQLSQTVVEACSMFKLGTNGCGPKESEWFDSVMMKQYNVLPRLKIENTAITASEHPETATDDLLVMTLDLTRLHAENFTRTKIAALQKQGIPPQVALSQYREVWWYFVTAERLDGETPASCAEINVERLPGKISDEDMKKFEDTKFEGRLLTSWPMMIANIAQKSGKVKIQFKAPSVAGKYNFKVAIKSQDFLGADQMINAEADIVDVSTLSRKPKAEEKAVGDDEDEGKKDK